jgi:hypothetical protein
MARRTKLAHGTGKYAGISGHGKYQISDTYIDSRDSHGKCSQGQVPVVFQAIFTASGPVKL